MSAPTLPTLQDLYEAIALLGATARNTLCESCRAADAGECQRAGKPCCDDCRHTLPAATVAAQAETISHALAVATTKGER